MSIYFITVDNAPERVKIGKAHDVKRRMYELSRYPSSAWRDAAEHATGARLHLAAECEGYSEVEAALHRMLAHARLYGEWFDATDPLVRDVLKYAASHGARTFATLSPDAFDIDRARACPHTTMRAMHPDGRCLLCEAGNTLTAPHVPPARIIKEPSHVEPRVTPAPAPAPAPAPQRAPRTIEHTAEDAEPALGTTSNIATTGMDGAVLAPVVAPFSDDAVAERLLAQLGARVDVDIDTAAADALALEDELAEMLRVAEGELARRSFAEFVRQATAAGAVHGLTRIQWAPHLDATCLHVQLLLEGWLVSQGLGTPEMVDKQAALWRAHGLAVDGSEPWLADLLVQNIVENICPGTLKSTIVMVCANAWIWLHAPHYKFGAASANDKNVERDSDATRDLVSHRWYRETFDITWKVRTDQDAKSLWATTAGGSRLSRTMGAGFTGQHVHGMFIDDPDDADRVWSDSERSKTQGKFSRAMENRVVDEVTCTRFILQQRVHVDDLSAFVLNKKRWSPRQRKGWAWLCIPLRFGYGPKDVPAVTPFGWRDWRTVLGEVMHPARFPADVIADKMISLGDLGYASQYEQNPQPLTGGLFPRAKARWFIFEGEDTARMPKRPEGCAPRDELPPIVLKRNRNGLLDLDWVCVSVDASGGSTNQKTASAVGITVYGGRSEERFVLDDRTEILGVQQQYDAIDRVIATWSPQCNRLLVENKALGDAVINEIDKRLRSGSIKDASGKPVRVVVERIKVPAGEGKIMRGRSAVPTWEAGLVYVHDGAAWVYPRHDDSGKVVDEGWIGEVCLFPFAKRDDRADVFSQMIAYYRENGEAEQRARALNVW